MLALGARAHPRYEHALTIDDHRMDETMHGLIQDIEGGYVKSLAFVAPARLPWQLPLYELALMTAARAYDMDIELAATIVTPEATPLAIFGATASNAVGERLRKAGIATINSAYAEVPSVGEVVINPGDRRLHVDRVVALPELYGPPVRGIPLAEHGFIRVDPYGQVPGAGPIYAAGDADRLRGQARRPRLPAGRRGGAVDRRARGRVAHARAVRPGDPRDAAHRRGAAVPHRAHHRRARVQLGDDRRAHVVAAEQDLREVSRALPRGARSRGVSGLSGLRGQFAARSLRRHFDLLGP